MAGKSVIASISQAEERPFKTPQLPALRAVVSEPAPQKRRFFLLLFLSTSANSRNEAQTVGGAWLLPSAERGHTAAHRAKHGRFFLLSAFRSTGRPKWVRASARNCGRRIAKRSACPTHPARKRSAEIGRQVKWANMLRTLLDLQPHPCR